jgi:hypothetical protein
LLLLGPGQHDPHMPPLVITTDQADFAAETIEECLRLLM